MQQTDTLSRESSGFLQIVTNACLTAFFGIFPMFQVLFFRNAKGAFWNASNSLKGRMCACVPLPGRLCQALPNKVLQHIGEIPWPTHLGYDWDPRASHFKAGRHGLRWTEDRLGRDVSSLVQAFCLGCAAGSPNLRVRLKRSYFTAG